MPTSEQKIRVLFLCTGNSCRSQMAEGWARALKSDLLEPYSAGIEKHGMNPSAVAVMSEAGVDISRQYSKTADELGGVQFDLVVTVCGHADQNCPTLPGDPPTWHVPFDDPPRLAANAETDDEKLEVYRRVRDEIRKFVLQLSEKTRCGAN